MRHPRRVPKVDPPESPYYVTYVNDTLGYAEATRNAILEALTMGTDLVVADSDGYHPETEIVKLALTPPSFGPVMVIPYRTNIGIQSRSFSLLYSAIRGWRIRDVTGGLYRLSYDLMRKMPPLKSEDMTVHLELVKNARRLGAEIIRYGYRAGINERERSNRTRHYQLKLLRRLL